MFQLVVLKIRRYPTLEVGQVYRSPSLAREAGKGWGAVQQVHIVMVKFSNKHTRHMVFNAPAVGFKVYW